MKEDKGTIKVTVRDRAGKRAPIAGALVLVLVYPEGGAGTEPFAWRSNAADLNCD
jgi:hypothetical protein